MLNNKKGVTFVELMITVIAIIVLSVVSYKLYGYQIEKSVATDGAQLMRKIVDAELAYRVENRAWTDSFKKLQMRIDGEFLSANDESSVKTKEFIFTLQVNNNTLIVASSRYYKDSDITNGSYAYVSEIKMRPGNGTGTTGEDKDAYVIEFDANTNSEANVEKSVVKYLKKKFVR